LKKNNVKTQSEILQKLNIEALNPMQIEAEAAIEQRRDVVLLSPTGTGKTLAFLLPLIQKLDPMLSEVQLMIVVPTRELAIQIEQVVREMGAGYKCNAVYGGQSFNKDKINLKRPPAILVGTPGRISDHLRRTTFSIENIKLLVLDEFDKSLEIGFESEMKSICLGINAVQQRILTSASNEVPVPPFVRVQNPIQIDYLSAGVGGLTLKAIRSPDKDKLETLVKALKHLGNRPGIVFCNFKDSIQRVSDFLLEHDIQHGCFFGGMEQVDRERALIKFRNGTHQLIIATDLAARGLDIPAIEFIIHYHLPLKEHEFVHRNGRTARMKSDGTAYVIKYTDEPLPDYVPQLPFEDIETESQEPRSNWKTLFISGGRKDKISKGDIAGLCIKQGEIKSEDLGLIELKQDCAFVAVKAEVALDVIRKIDGYRVKKRKIRVSGI